MTLKILVAEDSASNRILLSMTLRRLGCHADVVATGAAAAELFEVGGYDLVFLDLNMPGLSGVETAALMRKRNAARTPVYAVSGFASEEMERKFAESGIRRCLIKPLDREKLEEVMRECGLSIVPPTAEEGAPHAVPQKLLQTFMAELRARGAACTVFFNNGDGEGLLREAHTVRSIAQTLGDKALENAAVALEARYGGGMTPSLHPLVLALSDACVTAAEDIERRGRL